MGGQRGTVDGVEQAPLKGDRRRWILWVAVGLAVAVAAVVTIAVLRSGDTDDEPVHYDGAALRLLYDQSVPAKVDPSDAGVDECPFEAQFRSAIGALSSRAPDKVTREYDRVLKDPDTGHVTLACGFENYEMDDPTWYGIALFVPPSGDFYDDARRFIDSDLSTEPPRKVGGGTIYTYCDQEDQCSASWVDTTENIGVEIMIRRRGIDASTVNDALADALPLLGNS